MLEIHGKVQARLVGCEGRACFGGWWARFRPRTGASLRGVADGFAKLQSGKRVARVSRAAHRLASKRKGRPNFSCKAGGNRAGLRVGIGRRGNVGEKITERLFFFGGKLGGDLL